MNEEKLTPAGFKAWRRLMEEIEAEAQDTAFWTGRPRFSDAVMAAMRQVPRHEFVRPEDISVAYIDRPQGIGFGQTISQPYMVAVMTELLDLKAGDRVLEIGTGCGYQTAVLAQVTGAAGQVFSIERVPELAAAAGRRLKRLGIRNAEIRHGDGYAGWPGEAPFDAIMVTAAPERIPDALTRQIKAGRRMVIPVGKSHEPQFLKVCTRDEAGRLHTENTLPVSFVPMVRGRGSEPE
jgi:protein-L-isoaspartate(D-aspartate) O-methyltransferase